MKKLTAIEIAVVALLIALITNFAAYMTVGRDIYHNCESLQRHQMIIRTLIVDAERRNQLRDDRNPIKKAAEQDFKRELHLLEPTTCKFPILIGR